MKNLTHFFATAFFCLVTFSFTTQAQTYFHGGIYANTTWTLANSPYIITDTVVVFPGDTLTIDPGVVVKFDSTVYMEIRQATLIANGTAALPITFKANSTNAGRFFWNGILLNNIDSCYFNHCVFKNAQSAIGTQNSQNSYPFIRIRNSTFMDNWKGLKGDKLGNNNSNNNFYLLDSCNFIQNTIGIDDERYYQPNGILITNSSFFQNSYTAIFSYDYLVIHNSSFYKNYIGLNLDGSSFPSSSIIDNCKINSNFKGIITGNLSGNYQLQVLNSTIDSNQIGVANYTPYKCTIQNCLIKNNANGIEDIGSNNYSAGIVIKENIITTNKIGISGLSSDSIYCNKIFNDTLYDFYYNNTTSNANYHIGSNDWGDTSIANIRAKIYDGYTNIALGLVNFLPIDTSQCYLSACNLVLTPIVTNATCDTCHNGKIAVVTSNGGAPYHYTWYTTPLQTTATISNLKTGKYHFCVTDVRGCSACDTVFADSINCNAFHTTTKTITATCATCNDGSAKITHSLSNAPYLFAWNTIPVQNTDSATALSYGTHIGCVTDHNNCQSCDTVFIDSTRCHNFAVHLISTAVSCKTCNDGKAYATVVSGTSPYSFSWNTIPVGTADSITNQHFGMYTVIVTDANSCTTADSIYVDSVNCVGFTIQTFADSVSCNTCNNGKAYVHAQGGVLPYSYHWNSFPINLSDTIKNQHQGIYQVCVKDNQGCQLCQNMLIDSFNCGNMLVNAFGKNTTCGSCSNGVAWAVATGGATPYTYLWNTTQTTDSIKNISIGNYIVTATDLHGCKSADTIQIDSTLCFGFHATEHHFNPTCATCTDGVAWLTVNGGQQPYHYTWFTSPLQNSTSVNNLGIGTYTVCVNDANTCTVCDTIILNQYCSAQFIINPDTIPHHYFAVNMASGAAPIAYTWYWGDGASDTGVTPNHVYATAGFYTICLSIVDANNCTQTYCDSFYLMRMKNSMISLNVIKEKKINTGVEQLAVNEERLMVYPNPVTAELRVMNYELRVGNIEISNVIGQHFLPVITHNISFITIDVTNLPSGIYILKTTDNKGMQHTAKFVKE